MKKPKKKTTVFDIIWRIVFLAALAVFCYSAFRLLTIYLEYKKGTDEYSSLAEQYAVMDEIERESFGSNDGNSTQNEGGAKTDQESDSGKKEGNGTEKGEAESANNGSSTEKDPYTTGETETETEKNERGETIVRSYPVMVNPVDFDGLHEVNEDIIGWLRVNALDISYPIAQSTDNDYYLHRTFEKVENFAGCIFMEYQNSSDFSDKNTIIYGHNMKNGSMFGTLRKFYEEGVYEKAPYFWIYTPDKIYRYDIFSCGEVEATGRAYQITFADDDDFLNYIDEAFLRSVVDNSEIEMDAEDKIVTLSTCTGNEATRFVVQGKLARTYKSAKKAGNGN